MDLISLALLLEREVGAHVSHPNPWDLHQSDELPAPANI